MFRWCQLSAEKARWPTGSGTAAVLWDMRVTCVTGVQLVSSGQIQSTGLLAPASPAVAEEAPVTHILVTVTLRMRPQETWTVQEAFIGTAGTLIPASNVPVQMECPAQLRMDRCSPTVTIVHWEAQVKHFHYHWWASHPLPMTASIIGLRSPVWHLSGGFLWWSCGKQRCAASLQTLWMQWSHQYQHSRKLWSQQWWMSQVCQQHEGVELWVMFARFLPQPSIWYLHR